MHEMKKDPTFRKVMETRQDLKENERLETAELAVDHVSNKLFPKTEQSVQAFLQETKAIERARERGAGFVGFHKMTCHHIVTFSKVISE